VKRVNGVLLFIFCFFGVFALAPVAVQASLSTRTLQPGRVYTFTGLDSRVISHISVAGVGRYQYVAMDGNGNVTSYGFSFGRASVSGQGRVMLSPLVPIRVTFDPSRLTLREDPGEALRQISLAHGQTLLIQNTGRAGRPIRVNQAAAYDLVLTQATGGTTAVHQGIRFPQFLLPAGGEGVITADGNGLVVYFPAQWYRETLQSRRLNHPALFSQTLREGAAYVLTFTGERGAAVTAQPLFAGAVFSYDFILRNHEGLAISHGESTGNQITLHPHRPMTLTPHMDATLSFPYALRQTLHIGHGTDAPAYYTLAPGQSLRVANAGTLRTYPLYLSGEPGGYPIAFNYLLETETGISFGAQASRNAMTLPPGSALTITAGHPPPWAPQHLVVRFPDSAAISFAAIAAPLTHKPLEPGESFLFTNESDGEKSLAVASLAAEARTALDFTLADPYARVVAFGQKYPGEALLLAAGYRVHFTNPESGEAMGVFFPLGWDETALAIAEAATPALLRRTLEAGEILRLDNANTRYHKSVLIENPFEYVITDPRNAVLSYGTGATGFITLRYNSRFTLVPANNTPLTITYPAEWHNRTLRASSPTEPPLHRIVLRPGQQLTLRNPTGIALSLSNNSAPLGAGFTLREGPAHTQHGPIYLPPATTRTLTAARGADLHIWMPTLRARQLRLL